MSWRIACRLFGRLPPPVGGWSFDGSSASAAGRDFGYMFSFAGWVGTAHSKAHHSPRDSPCVEGLGLDSCEGSRTGSRSGPDGDRRTGRESSSPLVWQFSDRPQHGRV